MLPKEMYGALTVDKFCDLQNISTSKFYELRKLGLGPREMRLGGAVRISAQAALDWQRERENPGPAEAAAIAEQRERLLRRSENAHGGRRGRAA